MEKKSERKEEMSAAVLSHGNESIILSTHPWYIIIILCNEVVKYYLLPLYSNVGPLFTAHIIFLI